MVVGGNGQAVVGVKVVAPPGPGQADKVVPVAAPGKDLAGPADVKPGEPAKEEISGTTRSVFFSEDRELGARLRKAAQLRDAGRLQQAFDLYLWVLENGEDQLFRLDEHRFAGIRDTCLKRIAELPPDFLQQYRLRSDGDVLRLYDEAKATGDADEMESLGVRYFLSTPGPEILDHAGDLYAGSGRLARAVSCWRRMLKWGSTGTLTREVIETKLALALTRTGSARDARYILDDMHSRKSDVRITVAGASVPAVDWLEKTLPEVTTPPPGGNVGRNHWPQVGGDATHGRAMPGRFECDVKVQDFVIPGYDWQTQVPPNRGYYRPQNVRQMVRYAPFVPVYADGLVFIHDESGIVAFRPDAISPTWVAGEMGKSTGTNPRGLMTGGMSRAFACAVAGGAVYASLGSGNGGDEVWAVTEDGKVRWRVSKSLVGFEWLAGGVSLSDPVVHEGNVYVLAWKGESYRYDCYLMSLEASSGRLNWKRFICAGASMPGYYYGQMMWSGPVLNMPAAADDTVVVVTDLGGIAALDARTGEIRWGFAYEQAGMDARRMMMAQRNTQGASSDGVFASVPVIADGIVVAAPRDSQGVYAIDLDSGRCVWQAGRDEDSTLLGVSAGHVILAGDKVTARDLATGRTVWSTDESVDATGLGFVTTEVVYVPGREAIRRYDPASGKLLGRLRVEEERGEFGNLLLVEETMFQIGKQVNAYGLWNRVYAELERDMRLRPDDPMPHVRLGAIYARKEERTSSMRAYETSIRLMRNRTGGETTRQRDEVTRRLYGLYTEEVAASVDAGGLDRALTLAQRQRAYASDDMEHVALSAVLLDVHQRRGDMKSVVRELQALLENSRNVVYAFDGEASILPSLYARLRIAEVIAKHGRDVYDEFEQKARNLYGEGDRESLEKVVEVYPNASMTLRALKRLADMEASAGQFRKASRYLTTYLRTAGEETSDAVDVRWKLVGYEEHLKRYDTARGLLVDLDRRHGDAMIDGKPVRDAVAAKLATTAYREAHVSRPLASFTPPLARTMRLPVGGTPVTEESDVLLVLTNQGQLRAVDGEKGKQLWKSSVAGTAVIAYEVRGDRIMLCGRSSVSVLNVTTGESLWVYNVANPIGQALNRQVIQHSLVGAAFDDRYVAVNVGGTKRDLVLLDAQAGGKVIWTADLDGSPVWSPVIWQDRVAVTTVTGLAVYDATTGKRVIQVRGQRPRSAPLGLGDGRLLVAGIKSLDCIDLTAGKQLWTSPVTLYYSNYLSSPAVVRIDGVERLVAHTTDRKVVCVDLESGKIEWSEETGEGNDRAMGVRHDAENVYALLMRVKGAKRTVVVEARDLKTGRRRWISKELETDGKDDVWMVNTRDWQLGSNCIAVLADVYIRKMQNNNQVMQMGPPVVWCLDVKTGKTLQMLDLGEGGNVADMRNRPMRLAAHDDNLWLFYFEQMIALSGAK